jgi:hypothetical protein
MTLVDAERICIEAERAYFAALGWPRRTIAAAMTVETPGGYEEATAVLPRRPRESDECPMLVAPSLP